MVTVEAIVEAAVGTADRDEWWMGMVEAAGVAVVGSDGGGSMRGKEVSHEWERSNKNKPLWIRRYEDVTNEEY